MQCKNCEHLIRYGKDRYACEVYNYEVEPDDICDECVKKVIVYKLIDRTHDLKQ